MVRIADLEYGCAGLYLEIRILRKWTPHFKNRETWFLAIDKEGDTIAILGQQQGQKFLESKLKVTKCYGIQQYSCSETSTYQRAIRNTVHLNAGEASEITPLENRSEIPELFFDFVTVDDLNTFLKTPTYYPDFIGKYKRQGFSTKRNGDRFLLLTLTSTTGQEMTITMWKECIENADKVDLSALSAATAETMIAITNVKPGTYADVLKLSSTDATHVYINPTLPMESKTREQLAITDEHMQNTASYTVMNLEELQNKLYDNVLRKTIAVDARIVDTRFDGCWYTAACEHCKSQVWKQQDVWFCPNHGKNCNPTFYYNINATLSDETRNLEATCTDFCMQKLIGRSCKEIVMEEGYEERKTLPPSFKKQGMNTHRYHVEITKKSTPTNIKFVIVNKEPVPTELPDSQTIISISPQTKPSTTVTETTHTTPPPEIQTTPADEIQSTDKHMSTPLQRDKPAAAKSLSFETTGATDTAYTSSHLKENPPSMDKPMKDQNRKTTKGRGASATGECKTASQSVIPISHQIDPLPAITDTQTHVSPPQIPTTENAKKISTNVDISTTQDPYTPADMDEILQEQPPLQERPVIITEQTKDRNQTTEKDSESSTAGKRKTPTPTDELDIINPGKRERFPE